MRRWLVAFTLFAVALQAQDKKRVAVMNFEYGTVSSSVAQIWGTNVDIGKGIADMLVDRLVNDGKYAVYERKALEKLLGEQNFSNSDRADPSTAAKLGKVAGVQAILIGSITQFGRDDKSTSVGGGALGAYTHMGGLGGSKKESKAVVEITARLVDVNTGEILISAQGKGESKRSGASLVGAGGSGGSGGGAGATMGSSNFGATILGEATNAAVTECAGKLDEAAATLPTVAVVIDGLVADVSGSTIILNVGKLNGIKAGDHLQVSRVGREIKDPATGKVIRRVESPLGEVVITEVEDQSSTGNYSGSQPPQVGDKVKK